MVQKIELNALKENKVISLNELKNYPLIFQAKGSNTRNFLDNLLKEKI